MRGVGRTRERSRCTELRTHISDHAMARRRRASTETTRRRAVRRAGGTRSGSPTLRCDRVARSRARRELATPGDCGRSSRVEDPRMLRRQRHAHPPARRSDRRRRVGPSSVERRIPTSRRNATDRATRARRAPTSSPRIRHGVTPLPMRSRRASTVRTERFPNASPPRRALADHQTEPYRSPSVRHRRLLIGSRRTTSWSSARTPRRERPGPLPPLHGRSAMTRFTGQTSKDLLSFAFFGLLVLTPFVI
jgi:hypothetical protein